ncbi:NUMOD4 domain-containing protein, partial [Acinetobacter baumannii]
MDNYKIKVCRNRGVVKTRFVEGFGKNYIVSNLGQVFSVARSGNWKLKQLKPNVNHKGYSRVTLKNGGECKTLSLHRVVAHAFIENHLGKTQVNHINGIKSDNDVANLEWCT